MGLLIVRGGFWFLKFLGWILKWLGRLIGIEYVGDFDN